MISNEAKAVLERNIGLSLDQVRDLDLNSEIALIKARTGKDLIFSRNIDSRKIGRGSVLLARRRFTTIDEVNTKIDALQN